MRASLKAVLTLLLLVLSTLLWAGEAPAPWFSKTDNNQFRLRLEFFLSTTCPYCQKEDAFLQGLQAGRPWLEIHRYAVNQDKPALEYFHQRLRQQGMENYALPALFFCNSYWLGFDKPETTGRVLTHALDYCYQQVTKTAQLDRQTTTILRQWANSSFFAIDLANKTSAAVFIPLVALVDALASCSIFVVLALFAFLWLYKEKFVIAGLGLLYLIMVAIVHHFQQSHPFFFYQLLGGLQIPAILVGLWLIAYIFNAHSRGETIQPGLATPLLVAITAFIVEAYQQTCSPNFALIFTQWLDLQSLSLPRQDAYMALYTLFYLLPLILIIAAIIYCRAYKEAEKSKSFLIHVAWCLLLIMGVLLIFYPSGLSSFSLSLASLILSLLAAWLTLRRGKKT